MENNKWELTRNRFVAFFDIMGFKDIVERNTHKQVVDKLNLLKQTVNKLESANKDQELISKYNFSETRVITFSDSILIFTKEDTVDDATKILVDSAFLINQALENGIGIKGALSYGEITVDFENSLFFGRPIIDAYLLHEQLYLYTAALDNKFEAKINSLNIPSFFKACYMNYKTNLKTGKVHHEVINFSSKDVDKQINIVKKLYETVSGAPRVYIDNTIEFLQSLK